MIAFLMPFFAAQSAIGDRDLRQREAGAHDVRRRLGDARGGRRHHHHRRLALRGDRRGGQRRRRDAEAGEHRDLVVDDQLLREAAGRVGHGAVVLEDDLDLRPATLLPFCAMPELDRGVDLAAGGGLLAGHRQDQADLDRPGIGGMRQGRGQSHARRQSQTQRSARKTFAEVHRVTMVVKPLFGRGSSSTWKRRPVHRTPIGARGATRRFFHRAQRPRRRPIGQGDGTGPRHSGLRRCFRHRPRFPQADSGRSANSSVPRTRWSTLPGGRCRARTPADRFLVSPGPVSGLLV